MSSGILDRVQRAFKAVFIGGGILSSAAVLVIMVAVTIDISARGIFNHGVGGAFELSQLLMVVVVFFSFAICESTNQHIRVDSLVMRFPWGVGAYLDVLAYLLGLFLLGMMTYGSFQAAVVSARDLAYTGGVVAIPIYPFKFAVSVGCFLLVLQFIINAIRAVAAVVRGNEVKP